MVTRAARFSSTEILAAIAMLVALGVAGYEAFNWLAAPVLLNNAAIDLAQQLRNVEDQARDHSQFLTIDTVPACPGKPGLINLNGPGGLIESRVLPDGLAISGKITFDPRGLPSSPQTFTMRKGLQSTQVEVDSKGGVYVAPVSK